MARIAPGDLLAVLEVVVPVRRRDELAGRVDLHVQPRKAFVKPVADSSLDRIAPAVGLHVGAADRMPVAERQKRSEPELGLRAGVEQRVADQQLRPRVDPQQLLLENYAADPVGDGRCGRVGEIGDVFVPPGIVDSGKPVNRQIERLLVLDDGFVDRRQKDVVVLVPVVLRADHQSVVLARIAADDRRTHVPAGPVRTEHLALERILQIAQFVLVEM